jgi:hypothetical protein
MMQACAADGRGIEVYTVLLHEHPKKEDLL